MNYERAFSISGSVLLVLYVFITMSGFEGLHLVAQAPQSPTPIRVQINTPTSLPLMEQVQASPTMTPTATPEQGVFLQVRENVEGGVNVRSDADPDSSPLGLIQRDEQFPITGRYFRWLRFRYELSPTGQGWVYDELVDIVGDQSLIPDLSEEPEATTDATVIGATLTWEAITLTPGGLETATANARILSEPVEVGADGEERSVISSSGLPTFTPPPRVALISTPLPEVIAEPGLISLDLSKGIPPIMPILLLGGLGILGVFVSFFRR